MNQAKITGLSYQLQRDFQWSQLAGQLDIGGQWLNGEDQSGNSIADISPPQHRFSFSLFGDNSQASISVTHRQSSDHEISGELPTASVNVIDAGYTFSVNNELQIVVNITNMTNQHYVTSRDDLAPFTKGRDIHVSLSYHL